MSTDHKSKEYSPSMGLLLVKTQKSWASGYLEGLSMAQYVLLLKLQQYYRRTDFEVICYSEHWITEGGIEDNGCNFKQPEIKERFVTSEMQDLTLGKYDGNYIVTTV